MSLPPGTYLASVSALAHPSDMALSMFKAAVFAIITTTVAADPSAVEFDATATLSRSAFGLAALGAVASDEVTVVLHLRATPATRRRD